MPHTDKREEKGSQGVTLGSLLLPTTPSPIRSIYESLEERAKTYDFGLLEEDVVVLDTETTGLSFKNCELIEIAAARLSGREVVERYHTFVKPEGRIPPQIQALTNIKESDVVDAPGAEEAVAGLAEFVGGVPVLAHNAIFDRTFVEKVPGGKEVSDNWIDTLALSRIALPCLKSHRLSDMAQAFHCDSVTHRAMDDVDALCGMWRVILCGLAALPTGLLGRLADLHPEIDWVYRPIFSHLALETEGASFSLKEVRARLAMSARDCSKDDAAERLDPYDLPSRDEMDAAFASDGVVSRMYHDFESRPEQVAMAQEVREALGNSTHRAIEAGTGVGKSMAYLLPAIEFAQRNNVTVGVATKTNALTDQLVAHELPALDAVLPDGVSFCALKGYDHYPCLLRLERAASGELPLSQADMGYRSESAVGSDMLTAIAVTYAYSSQVLEGDLDTLGIRWRFVPRSMLTIGPSDCIHNRCPFYPKECFIHGARRRAASADIVVTNHSLLLRNVAADNAILPPIRHWIIDEAHGFESEARRQWAEELSAEKTRETFERLGGSKTGTLHALLVSMAGREGSTLTVGLLTKAAASAARASTATASLYEAIHGLVGLTDRTGGYENVTLWIDERVRESEEWQSVVSASTEAVEKLSETSKCLDEARESLAEVDPQLADGLGEATRGISEMTDAIKDIVVAPQDNMVYSAELYRQRKRIGQEKLVAEKLDIGADLAERWMPEMESVIFTSATMAVGKSFNHFNHAVGFDRLQAEKYKDLQLDSSYDFDNHMSVILAQDLPAPQDKSYLAALTDLLFDVHTSMEGSVLTLFTNRREMERVYADLKPRLAEAGLEVVCQERGSSPRQLRERFLAEKRLSLMALKSFWEGFDAAGDTLRCVVIPKLPFASPQDPLVKERELREDRAWWRYSLPDAVLSVKQAAGRLIRTAGDTGVLVLADSRLVTKRYGRDFINSLPSHNIQRLETENVGKYIRMWRTTHESTR